MDRKSIIILVLCFAALLLWQPLVVNKLYPPKKPVPGATNIVASPTAPATNATSSTQQAPVPVAPSTTNVAAPALNVPVGTEEELIELETEDARYTFTSFGGGLKSVELIRYKEDVPRRRGGKASQEWVKLNVPSRVPALAVLGSGPLQGDGIYKLTRTENGVRAEKTESNGVSVVKEFVPGSNYLLNVSLKIQNESGQAIALPQREVVTGTATPLNEHDDGSAVGVMYSDGQDAKNITAGWFANATLGCIPGTPRLEYSAGESNVARAAAYNQFFALAVMAKEPAERIVIRRFELPAPSAEQLRVDSRLTRNRMDTKPPWSIRR